MARTKSSRVSKDGAGVPTVRCSACEKWVPAATFTTDHWSACPGYAKPKPEKGKR